MTYRTFMSWRFNWGFKQIALYLYVITHLCQGYDYYWPLCRDACVKDRIYGIPTFCALKSCSSEDYVYSRCELGGSTHILSATVFIRYSVANCTYHGGPRDTYAGIDGIYGFEKNVLWVDHGCRASFTLCYIIGSSFWPIVPSTQSTSTKSTTAITQRRTTHPTTLDYSSVKTKRSQETEPNFDSTTLPSTRTKLPSAGTVPPKTSVVVTTKQTRRTISTKPPSRNTSPQSDPSYLTTVFNPSWGSSHSPGESIESSPTPSANYPASTFDIHQMSSTTFTSTSDENNNYFAVIGIAILAVVVVLGFIILGVAIWRKRYPTEDATVSKRLVL